MKITCPFCQYERDAPLKASPPRSINVTCQKCRQQFTMEIGNAGTPQKQAPAQAPAPPASPPRPNIAPAPPPVQPPVAAKAPEQPRPSAAVIPATPPKPWVTHKIGYMGKGSALFGIYMTNTLLTVLTLGIYSFWGKVKVRKFLLGSTELMGERFAYTGTARELLNGWFKAAGILFLAFGVPRILARFVHPAFGSLAAVMAMVIIPVAMVSSRRYRLSRTIWHGVRFSFEGHAKDFLKLYTRGSLLTTFTLGFYSTYFHVQRETFWRNNTRYGSGRFKYAGDARDLKSAFLRAWLLTIPTLGISWIWYAAKRTRYDWERTSFDGLTFSSSVTARDLFAFHAINALIIIPTLGFGMPFVAARNIKFLASHLAIKGDIEFESLEQVAPAAKAVGDGLVGILDIDMGM